jgi:predicted RNA methylase
VRRLRSAIARHGPYAAALFAMRYASRPLRQAIRLLRERSFDRRYGVDTRGPLPLNERGEGRDAEPYEGVAPRLFNKIKRLNVDPEALTFIDIGCGKGKALVLAGDYRFRRVIGIELAEELAKVARENLRVRGIRGQVDAIDATRMQFPDEPLLVFLYNPFGEVTLRAVLEQLQKSLRASPRVAFVVYAYPRQNHVFADFPDFTHVACKGRWPERRWWMAWKASPRPLRRSA